MAGAPVLWSASSVSEAVRGADMVRRGEPLKVYLDDVVRLRKPHPCGSFEWIVVRLGADIGLRCTGCGRKVLLPRRDLEKRLKSFVVRGPEYAVAVVQADNSVPGADATDLTTE